MRRYLLLIFVLLMLNLPAAAFVEGDHSLGWHSVSNVKSLYVDATNETGHAVSRFHMYEIYSGVVTDIEVSTSSYYVTIGITEPNMFKTTMQINYTDQLTGNYTSTTHTFMHLKNPFANGKTGTPIYVLIGSPPANWGVHHQGITGKTYVNIDLVAHPLIEMPATFALGWDRYYSGFIEPGFKLYFESDGPITCTYEVITMEEAQERRDEDLAGHVVDTITGEGGVGDIIKESIRAIPYIGPLVMGTLEVIYIVMKVFISVVAFVILCWPILLLLFWTLSMARGIAYMKSHKGIEGVSGVFTILAQDTMSLIKFTVYVFTGMYGLLISAVRMIRG